MQPLENVANLRRRYSDIDLVVSCGDMPAAYLDFIATILGKPLLYVRGNHDEMYDQTPPGGTNLHELVYEYGGLSFAGLEGSIKYNNGSIQYTQSEMHVMVLKLAVRLKYYQMRTGRRLDVFVAHSPARDIHDGEDFPHRGFDAFLRLMQWAKPRYMFHGHVHTWDRRKTVHTDYEATSIININPYTVLDIDPVTKAG
ncbi:MAG: metallophosphoesterase family protein [Anaerolineae bacterium]|nr:metallophosphoesterase family protein [Anaerolineae bacterium]